MIDAYQRNKGCQSSDDNRLDRVEIMSKAREYWNARTGGTLGGDAAFLGMLNQILSQPR